MTTLEKKILIRLFLLRTEPRKEEYRLDMYTSEEIMKIVSSTKETIAQSLSDLYREKRIERFFDKKRNEVFFYLDNRGKEAAKSLILSLTKTLQ